MPGSIAQNREEQIETPTRMSLYDMTITHDDTEEGFEAVESFMDFIMNALESYQTDNPKASVISIDIDFDEDGTEYINE